MDSEEGKLHFWPPDGGTHGVFHDSRRVNEGTDPGHGRRGAELAVAFRDEWFTISDQEFDYG